MATNQDKLDYGVSPQFKADIWAGGSDAEREARKLFIGELLNHGIRHGDTDRVTSLAEFLQWNASGLDTVYRAVLANGAKLDALIANVAAIGADEVFDSEKFLDDVGERIKEAMKDGLIITIT